MRVLLSNGPLRIGGRSPLGNDTKVGAAGKRLHDTGPVQRRGINHGDPNRTVHLKPQDLRNILFRGR